MTNQEVGGVQAEDTAESQARYEQIAQAIAALPEHERNVTNQTSYDMQWRRMMLDAADKTGPGLPLYFPTCAMRAVLMGLVQRLVKEEVNQKDFVDELTAILLYPTERSEFEKATKSE